MPISNRRGGVDGLEFGSGHLDYQQRVGNVLPAYILLGTECVIGKNSALVSKKNWTLPNSSPSTTAQTRSAEIQSAHSIVLVAEDMGSAVFL